MRNPELVGAILNFLFDRIVILSPGESISPSGSKNSSSTEERLPGQKAQNVLVDY